MDPSRKTTRKVRVQRALSDPPSSVYQSKNEHVSLSREELEELMDARVKKAVLAEREEWKDAVGKEQNKRKDLEALVSSLLKEKESEKATGHPGHPPALNEEGHNTSKEPVLTCTSLPTGRPEPSYLIPAAVEEVSMELPRQGPGRSMPLVDKQPSEEHKQENEDNWHVPFGESTYTLIYFTKMKSQGFWFGTFIWALKIALIGLILIDQISLDTKDNILQIPPMVDVTVTVVQALALFVTLAYASDLIEAILKIQNGFYQGLLDEYPGATFSTWLFACTSQLFAGLSLVVASLILTMAAESVIVVMLNFAALLFITELDDLAFALAEKGFITNTLQSEALSVQNVQIPRRKSKNRIRRLLYVIILVGLFIGYGILKHKQLAGDFLPTHIYVQFGDDYNPTISYYSGIFTSAGKGWTATYREYRDMTTEKLVLLGYCEAEKSWAFSESNDPCNFFAKSLETTTYDVTSIPASDWQVVDSIGRLQPFGSFSLVNRDCDPEACQGTCDSDGLCQCTHDNQFGMDCEFSDVCPTVTFDDRFGGFPDVPVEFGFGGRLSTLQLGQKFQLLQNASAYHMPVYYCNKTYPANILFFGGRRWILTSEWDFFNLTQAREFHGNQPFLPGKTAATFNDNFHGYHSASYTPFYISDPVDFETPDFQPTPIGLGWWTATEKNGMARHYVPDVPLGTKLVCNGTTPVSCFGRPENFCGDHGWCNDETGICQCGDGHTGARCQLQMACPLPHYGPLCKETYKCFEEKGKCQQGGVCNMTTGVCYCPDPATSGAGCERRLDCHIFGCANGGICGANGACYCYPPFNGVHCDLLNKSQEGLFCAKDEHCMNGKCNVETGICSCEDPSIYGTLCEHHFNCNKGQHCSNLGHCNNSTGRCQCYGPYFGPDCSQVPPCQSDSDCGRIYDHNKCDTDTGFCNCKAGPTAGKKCEKSVSCSSDNDCFHGGTCNGLSAICENCHAGYGGILCESLIAGEYNPLLDHGYLDGQKDAEHYEWDDIKRCGFEDAQCDQCWKEDPPPKACACGTEDADKRCEYFTFWDIDRTQQRLGAILPDQVPRDGVLVRAFEQAALDLNVQLYLYSHNGDFISDSSEELEDPEEVDAWIVPGTTVATHDYKPCFGLGFPSSASPNCLGWLSASEEAGAKLIAHEIFTQFAAQYFEGQSYTDMLAAEPQVAYITSTTSIKEQTVARQEAVAEALSQLFPKGVQLETILLSQLTTACPTQHAVLFDQPEALLNHLQNCSPEDYASIGGYLADYHTRGVSKIYQAISRRQVQYVLDSQLHLQASLSAVQAIIYTTTGQTLSGKDYYTGPLLINQQNVPSDTTAICQHTAFPVCADDTEDSTAIVWMGLQKCPCTQRRSIKLGGVLHGTLGGFWDPVFAGARQAAEDMNVQLEMHPFDNKDDFQLLIDQMSAEILNLCESGSVDGLMVSIPHAQVAQAVGRCLDLLVPVISINSGYQDSLELGAMHHIGQNEYDGGFGAAQRLIEAGMKVGYCVDHEFGNTALAERCQGFRDAIEANSTSGVAFGAHVAVPRRNDEEFRINVEQAVGNLDTDWEGVGFLQLSASSFQSLLPLLDEHPGAVVGSFDLKDYIFDALEAGVLEFTIDQQPFLQGNLPIYLLTYDLYTKQSMSNHLIQSGPSFVTQILPNEAHNYRGHQCFYDPPPDWCGCGTEEAHEFCFFSCGWRYPPPDYCGCDTEDAHDECP